MYELYIGIEHEGKQYNHFKFKEIEGGLRKALNIKAPTMTLLVFKFFQAAISELYDKDGNALELTPELYGKVPFIDGFAIARAAQKYFTKEDYPAFEESLRCERCSKGVLTHYVTIKEAWDKLIEKGDMEEIFLDSIEKAQWEVELETGLEISGQVYKKLHCRMATFDSMVEITDYPEFETETDFQNALCDSEIFAIEGMDEKTLKIEKRKAGFGRFLDRYVKNQADWDLIELAKPKVGLVAEDRVVKCDKCRGTIKGYDLRNFFFFLTSTQNPNGQLLKDKKRR